MANEGLFPNKDYWTNDLDTDVPSMPQDLQPQGFNPADYTTVSNMGSGWSQGRQLGGTGPMSTYANPNVASNPNNFMNQSMDAPTYGDALGQVYPNLILGGLQTAVGLGGLMTQGDIPQYQEPERLQQAYREYGRIAEQGLPEVNAAYEQRVQRGLNTARQEAMDQAGPSTSNAIQAAFTGRNIEGQRQLAEMEADQRMRGLQRQTSIGQTLRQLEDQRTQASRQRYGQEESAYAGAAQSGMQNMGNAFNLATGIYQTSTGNPMGLMQLGKGVSGFL